jgi:hypothetical protein
MWALAWLIFYGTFVVSVESWLDSRAAKRRSRR